MYPRTKFSESAGAVFLYILVGGILLLGYRGSFSTEQLQLYLMLMLAYFWIAGLLVVARSHYKMYVFEPLLFVGILYLAIFVIKPVVDLKYNDQLTAHGINVLGGGAKATAIVILSFTCMFIGYYWGNESNFIDFRSSSQIDRMVEAGDKEPFSLAKLYLAWTIVFALCLICMLSEGISLSYIFSFGSGGERESSSNTALLFLSNFGITLVLLTEMILFNSKNIPVKVITILLTLVYILMRNSRWLMLAFILAPITYYFIRRRREPNGFIVLIGGLLALTVFAWMQENRYVLATGGALHGWGSGGFTFEKLLAPLESDLNTYKTFYSMVQRFPGEHAYMLGETFLYVFLLFIPRAIWPGKPTNPVQDMIEYSLNKSARTSGTAVCNIGEMYANFGILGCILLMFLFGVLLSKLKVLLQSGSTDRLFAYSIIYSVLFQWVARGNFSGNFYMTIFAVLPFIVKWTWDKVFRKM
ncbi:MAG: oligosaccharide repeat unit polymerase [Firmicutes bacterium]|nr:oligosaccharide repeat unit polymerase [Bacillota bacterium]